MDKVHVVTCFLEHDSKILLLKRSRRVGSYQERWAGISGYLDPGNTPRQQAWQELAEELGLAPADVILTKAGDELEVLDQELKRIWVVHPFRFHLMVKDKIRLDWEHTEYRWIDPEEMKGYTTVPQLVDAWRRVM